MMYREEKYQLRSMYMESASSQEKVLMIKWVPQNKCMNSSPYCILIRKNRLWMQYTNWNQLCLNEKPFLTFLVVTLCVCVCVCVCVCLWPWRPCSSRIHHALCHCFCVDNIHWSYLQSSIARVIHGYHQVFCKYCQKKREIISLNSLPNESLVKIAVIFINRDFKTKYGNPVFKVVLWFWNFFWTYENYLAQCNINSICI